jgi:4-diphosphocytidyl-2-C-methyl-D-erythritol kinase
MPTPLVEAAPAKLNLYLHITGRRADGYHDLDSLVAFAGCGDEIRVERADEFKFVLEGPLAAALRNEPPENNLAVKAAFSLAELLGRKPEIKLTLGKNLPVASGIGGGSSDAAATLRALARLWHLPANDPRILEAAQKHGQDVPVCLKIDNNYMTAEGTSPAPSLPHTDVVLVNPNKALPTPDVYKAFRDGSYGFTPKAQLTEPPRNIEALIAVLKDRRNDLYEPACQVMPEVGDVIKALEKTNPLLARMSGSGATCFGLYADRIKARAAAASILTANPGWWVAQSYIPARAKGIAES